jgi:hypothetical protein
MIAAVVSFSVRRNRSPFSAHGGLRVAGQAGCLPVLTLIALIVVPFADQIFWM